MAEAKVQITINAKDNASKVLSGVGKSAADLGKTLAVGIAAGGAAIAAGLGAAVKSAADFDKQMSAVRAAAGASGAEMAQLSDLALKLGADTSKSASEAAQGIEELVKAGVPVQDVLGGAATAAINLSEATGTGVATAAEVAAAAMATFGKTGADMAAVTDTITGAVNQSKADVSDFALGIAAAGTSAAAVGLSFEDLSTALTAMSRAGLSGSDAGTSLKNMLASLAAPTKQQTDLLRELGIVTADGTNKFFTAEGGVRSYSEVAGVLEDALGGMTQQQKLATLETLFGRDAMRAALVTMDLGAEGAKELGEAVNRQGQAAEAARARMDNLAGDVEQLGGAAETAAIKLGQAFEPAAREATQALTGFVNDNVIPFINEHGPGLAQAAADAAKGIGNFASDVKNAVNEGLQQFGQKLDEIGAQLAPWAAENEKAGKAVELALAGAHSTADALQLLLAGNFSGAAETAKQALEQFRGSAENAAAALNDSLAPAIENVRGLMGGVQGAIADTKKETADVGAWDKLAAAMANVHQIGTDLKAIAEGLAGAFPPLRKETDELRKETDKTGGSFNVVAAIINDFTFQLKTITDSVGAVVSAAKSIGDAFNTVGSAADRAGGAVQRLKNLLAGGGFSLPNITGLAAEAGANLGRGVREGITGQQSSVNQAGASLGNAAVSGLQQSIRAESPSRVAMDIGEDFSEGFEIGIEQSIPSAQESAADLGESAAEAMAAAVEETTPEAESAAVDLGQSVVDAIAAGLGGVKIVDAFNDLKGTVAGAMQDLSWAIDDLNRDTERKFAEIGRKAGDAIRDAVSDASRQIQDVIRSTANSIADLEANFGRGRAERAAREALTGRLDTDSLERARRREIEDLERDRMREDKELAIRLERDLQRARTAEERAGIIERASEARDDLLRRRKAEDEDRAYRRAREDEDREFRKAQERELRAFEDKIEEDNLRRSIERAQKDRDERIKAINDALAEKQRKIDEDAKEEQRKLLEATKNKIATLKDEFVAKLPPLTAEAQGIIESFLAGVDQALARTAAMAQQVASTIGGISGAGGGGGAGGGESAGGTRQFTIPLEGGGEMHVNASDYNAALENVVQQGGTPKSDETRFQGQFHDGGVVGGARGSDQWIMAAGGETVLPTHKQGAITIELGPKSLAALQSMPLAVSVDDIQSAFARLSKRNGGVVGF